jgi:hypothetical protein
MSPSFSSSDSSDPPPPPISPTSRKEATTSELAGAEFEYQEMKIRLDDMRRAGIGPRDLSAASRRELLGYVRRVVAQRRRRRTWAAEDDDDGGGGSSGAASTMAMALPGSEWRLVFSSEGEEEGGGGVAVVGDSLPRDSTVVLRFVDAHRLDYVLKFGKKTLGLDNLTARSRWWSADGLSGGNGEPDVIFVYEKVTFDAGPFKNVGVGLFGMLQGRAARIVTAYFDSEYWIERASSSRGPIGGGGDEVFNVYVRHHN